MPDGVVRGEGMGLMISQVKRNRITIFGVKKRISVTFFTPQLLLTLSTPRNFRYYKKYRRVLAKKLIFAKNGWPRNFLGSQRGDLAMLGWEVWSTGMANHRSPA